MLEIDKYITTTTIFWWGEYQG